jgi:hypothetical protein
MLASENRRSNYHPGCTQARTRATTALGTALSVRNGGSLTLNQHLPLVEEREAFCRIVGQSLVGAQCL